MHDGRANTYTFTEDLKKIILVPLKPDPIKKPRKPEGGPFPQYSPSLLTP